jgi:chromosome segregation ATPase
MEYLRRRMEAMERELLSERERARGAENLLKQQELLRAEVESHLKALSEQMRQQKAVQDLEESKQSSQGRVAALEQRLDEMHKTWASLLKESVSGGGGPGGSQVCDALAALQVEVAGLRKCIQSAPDLLSSDIGELRSLVSALARTRSEDEALKREQVREMIAAFGDSMGLRLREIGERLREEICAHQERLEEADKERRALALTIEEQRQSDALERRKDKESSQERLDSRLLGLESSLRDLQQGQAASSGAAHELRELAQSIHSILTLPEKAKDEILAGLEAEKRDLMAALRERTEACRAASEERRNAERKLEESLDESLRHLEAERSEHRKTRERAADLERTVSGMKAESERLSRVEAERDELLASLAEESERLRSQISDRRKSEEGWEARLIEERSACQAEREKRLQAEGAAADLRGQTAALGEHISRLLREGEAAESRASGWQKEREELLSQLRKKEEMVAMLSSTFRNLLKAPAAARANPPLDRPE